MDWAQLVTHSLAAFWTESPARGGVGVTLCSWLALIYNPGVTFLRKALTGIGACLVLPAPWTARAAAQQSPTPSGARILLLPRRAAAGEAATLAVLDMNGRLTPGATVIFTTGTRVTTD